MHRNVYYGFVCGLIATFILVYIIQMDSYIPDRLSVQNQASSSCRIPYPVQSGMSAAEAENAFYRFIERTTYKCEKSMRMGNKEDGGWNRCGNPDVELHPPNCLVYSFGIADDWTFDDDMAQNIGCQVFSFDPSIKVKSHQRSKNNTFLKAGLGGQVKGFFQSVSNWWDWAFRLSWNLKTLGEWRKTLKHDKIPLDYLKFDIEGGEWPALEAMFAEGSLQDVRQLALEIHIYESPFHRYLPLLHTLESIHGFRKWSSQMNKVEVNLFESKITGQIRSACYELVYVNSRFLKNIKCEE